MEIWEWSEVPKTVIALSLKRAKYDFFLFVYIM